MFVNSMKQLMRKPGKALVFFLLMSAATMLVVFGTSMYLQSVERIEAAKGAMTTIGYISQPFDSISQEGPHTECENIELSLDNRLGYDKLLYPEDLMFEGAPYVVPPESRPYYIAYNEDVSISGSEGASREIDTYEFTVTQDHDSWEPVQIDKAWRVYLDENGNLTREERLFTGVDMGVNISGGMGADYDKINEFASEEAAMFLCQHHSETPVKLKKGVTYIGNIGPDFFVDQSGLIGMYVTFCQYHGVGEWTAFPGPSSSRCDRRGNPVELSASDRPWVEEVTPGFYEGDGWGSAWLNSNIYDTQRSHFIKVTAPRSMELLPSYRKGKLKLMDGRIMTPQEFESGAKVCMVSWDFSMKSLLRLGDKVNLPLICSMYNTKEVPSLFDVDGNVYEPFWQAEYEIVGIYDSTRTGEDLGDSNVVIIPRNSVEVSDENNIAAVEPMRSWSTVFQLENGTVEEFDKALKAAVPGAEKLNISYDDNGYAGVIDSLKEAQRTALLLLAVGALAALTVMVLLLYFFIVRERKRTAVERSLGLSKSQCRVSLISGLMVLTVAAAILGSVLGGVLLENTESFLPAQEETVEETDQIIDWGLDGHYDFNSKFSIWPSRDGTKADLSSLEEINPPAAVYLIAPALMCALVLILSLVLVNQGMKIEPVLLLSTKA